MRAIPVLSPPSPPAPATMLATAPEAPGHHSFAARTDWELMEYARTDNNRDAEGLLQPGALEGGKSARILPSYACFACKIVHSAIQKAGIPVARHAASIG